MCGAFASGNSPTNAGYHLYLSCTCRGLVNRNHRTPGRNSQRRQERSDLNICPMLLLYREYSLPSASRSAKHTFSCSRSTCADRGCGRAAKCLVTNSQAAPFPARARSRLSAFHQRFTIFDNNQRNISRGFQSRDMQAGVPAFLQATTT